jgi:hypothetical protein
MSNDIPMHSLIETENFGVWLSEEPDGEHVYHLEFNSVTLHLLREEWEELLEVVRVAAQEARKRGA